MLMRKSARCDLVLSLLLGLSLTPLIAPAADLETIRITNGEWPPFTSEQLPYGGTLSRIVSEAFALEGVTVQYGYFPWKRAYAYARSGSWDGSVGWEPNPAHLADFAMSKPLLVVDKALYHLKSVPFDWRQVDDLRRWRVGATAGYSYGRQWDQAVSSGWLKVEEVTLDEQNLRKLLAKRIDVVAMETAVADYLIRTRLSPEDAALITHHRQLVAQTSISLALSRQRQGSAQLLQRFNRGLQRLKSSGKYDEFLAEHRR